MTLKVAFIARSVRTKMALVQVAPGALVTNVPFESSLVHVRVFTHFTDIVDRLSVLTIYHTHSLTYFRLHIYNGFKSVRKTDQ